jgi:rod shape determining protein RodA
MTSRTGHMTADIPLVLCVLLLCTYGVLMVYSAGQAATASGLPAPESTLWIKQLSWLALAVVAAFIASRVSLRVMEYMAVPVFIISMLLLIATVVGFGSGAGTAQGTTSWLTIMGRRVGQPSELAKIAVVLILAKILASRKEVPDSLFQLWRPLVAVLLPTLIIIKQRDLGTAMVFFGVLFVMLYWSGVRWQLLILLASPFISLLLASSTRLWGIWFVLLLVLLVSQRPSLVEGISVAAANVATGVVAEILWRGLDSYQRDRLLTFLDPSVDPRGAGYNVIQSMTAIGSGGWFGQGFNEGTQKKLSFIPEQETDFIFAVVGEELGFVGVCLALSLFLALLLRTTRIAARSNDEFASLAAIGLSAVWLVHIVVNVGMTLNLLPVTGIPLPFFSYGGSFLLACWLCVGLLHRISVEGRGPPDAMAL